MRCHLLVYSTDSSSSSGTEARAEHSVQVCSVGGRDPVPSEAAPVASQNQPQQEVGIRRQAQEWGPALTPDVGFRLHARLPLPQLLCSIPVPQKLLFSFFFFYFSRVSPALKKTSSSCSYILKRAIRFTIVHSVVLLFMKYIITECHQDLSLLVDFFCPCLHFQEELSSFSPPNYPNTFCWTGMLII